MKRVIIPNSRARCLACPGPARLQRHPCASDAARQAPATVAAEASAAGGAPEEKETPIMDYPAHQRKLLPLLATGARHYNRYIAI